MANNNNGNNTEPNNPNTQIDNRCGGVVPCKESQPQVNNDNIACDEILGSDCVVILNSYSEYSPEKNIMLGDILERINIKFKVLKVQISDLQRQINTLK